MNYAYLRVQNIRHSIAFQEKSIELFASKKSLGIDEKEVEISPFTKSLEEREDFLEFLQSLKEGDTLFVYELSVLSNRVGEIVKILNCLFKKEITIYFSRYQIKVDISTPAKIIISLLNEIRENFITIKHKGIGRPKGSLSKSKYDKFRDEIINYLKEGKSVSQISKILDVSRTSLRDYIVSRDLKELAIREEDINKRGEIFVIPASECKINFKKDKL